MSEEEQDALIGRLVIERAKARRESALLWSEITSTSILMGNISGTMAGNAPNLEMVASRLDELSTRGGLERLRDQINERKALDARIAEISKTLKDAGAE